MVIPDVWTIRAGVSFGMFRPTTERSEMSEETQFWGVVVPRWPAHMWPHGTGLLPWRGKLPDGKLVHCYPLFSSKKKAEEFVLELGQELRVSNPQLIEQTLQNIRRIYRDEIPDDHYVNRDGRRLVPWSELLQVPE
jgi:hypothetical protein